MMNNKALKQYRKQRNNGNVGFFVYLLSFDELLNLYDSNVIYTENDFSAETIDKIFELSKNFYHLFIQGEEYNFCLVQDFIKKGHTLDLYVFYKNNSAINFLNHSRDNLNKLWTSIQDRRVATDDYRYMANLKFRVNLCFQLYGDDLNSTTINNIVELLTFYFKECRYCAIPKYVLISFRFINCDRNIIKSIFGKVREYEKQKISSIDGTNLYYICYDVVVPTIIVEEVNCFSPSHAPKKLKTDSTNIFDIAKNNYFDSFYYQFRGDTGMLLFAERKK